MKGQSKKYVVKILLLAVLHEIFEKQVKNLPGSDLNVYSCYYLKVSKKHFCTQEKVKKKQS